jgi:hypothetical protein
MPLFGHKNDNITTSDPNAIPPTGHHDHTGPGAVTGGIAGGAAGHGVGHTGVGTALGATVGEHHARTHPANDMTTTHHGHTGPGLMTGGAAGGLVGNQMGHTGAGTALGAAAGEHHAHTHPTQPYSTTGGTVPGAGVGTTHGAGMAGTHPGAATHAPGATEKAFVGKLEHAAGTVLCSSTLRAKGIEKEREAQALKVQAAELGQAEGLEAEADARRQRAVAHGAHPQHLNAGHVVPH